MKTLTLAIALAMAVYGQTDKNKDKNHENRQKPGVSSMTGCVDQQGETYRLLPEGQAVGGVELRGRAFSDDNFARYLGSKVTVRGSLEGNVFHVTDIRQVSETCR